MKDLKPSVHGFSPSSLTEPELSYTAPLRRNLLGLMQAVPGSPEPAPADPGIHCCYVNNKYSVHEISCILGLKRTINSLHDGFSAEKQEPTAITLSVPTQRRHQSSVVHRSISVTGPFVYLHVSYTHIWIPIRYYDAKMGTDCLKLSIM